MKVFPDSPLAKHFRPLDVIQTVNGRAIRSADDVVKALDRRADGELDGSGGRPRRPRA